MSGKVSGSGTGVGCLVSRSDAWGGRFADHRKGRGVGGGGQIAHPTLAYATLCSIIGRSVAIFLCSELSVDKPRELDVES